jgi:hypothetical protein
MCFSRRHIASIVTRTTRSDAGLSQAHLLSVSQPVAHGPGMRRPLSYLALLLESANKALEAVDRWVQRPRSLAVSPVEVVSAQRGAVVSNCHDNAVRLSARS